MTIVENYSFASITTDMNLKISALNLPDWLEIPHDYLFP